MRYDITLYEPKQTSLDLRFLLGTSGTKPLFVIGLNPSTADDKIPDTTVKKVMGFALRHGCDSFIMLNLYAQRTKNPNELHDVCNDELHKDNVAHMLGAFEQHKDIFILASWGETIKVRTFLKGCLLDIYNKTENKNINWLKIGNLTQSGHPRHPSRGRYLELNTFDIEDYLLTI